MPKYDKFRYFGANISSGKFVVEALYQMDKNKSHVDEFSKYSGSKASKGRLDFNVGHPINLVVESFAIC